MWGFVVLLAVWMTYVETEMPNRVNECEFDNSCELFTDEDLSHQNKLRYAFDPQCRINPGKILPTGHSCADIQTLHKPPEGIWV